MNYRYSVVVGGEELFIELAGGVVAHGQDKAGLQRLVDAANNNAAAFPYLCLICGQRITCLAMDCYWQYRCGCRVGPSCPNDMQAKIAYLERVTRRE